MTINLNSGVVTKAFIGLFVANLLAGFFAPATILSARQTGERYASFAGFRLNVGTLADVRAALGPAKLIESGEAGEYKAQLCYRTARATVRFLSGEMGGPTHDLLGFGIAEVRGDDSANCPAWPANRRAPPLSIGDLSIGISRAEFERRVGVTVQHDGSTERAFFSSTREFTPADISTMPPDVQRLIAQGKSQDYLDVQMAVEGVFRHDRLIALQVWKVVSL